MTSLSAAVILQAAIVATGADDYATAHRALTDSGKPMVVMVGADWCGACQTMKQTVIPQARKRGLFRKVAYAFVNLDRNRELGQQLTDGGPIPQLIMYRKTSQGWRRRTLIGSQSVRTLGTFIDEGIKLDEAAKAQPASQKQDSDKARPQRSAGIKPVQNSPQPS